MRASRASRAAPLLGLALGLSDASPASWAKRPPGHEPASACEGRRPPPAPAIYLTLRSGAFPGSSHPDAAVHVPPGFDATRAPGVVLYFHGWRGCVTAALEEEDVPCDEEGDPRPGSRLASQIDEAGVNALLVAVELRVDASTGETGELSAAGGARAILGEVLRQIEGPIGCALEVDGIERIVVVAHSGGYQAAATVLELGELPQVSEVVLLDGLYGADDVFRAWIGSGRRLVDLYTCCGGTLERSRSLAAEARLLAGSSSVFDDDGDADLDPAVLERPAVFKRVPRSHGELPRVYVRAVVERAGFPRIVD